MGDDDDLRAPPDVHGRRQQRGVHLHFVAVLAGGHFLSGWADARDLRGRWRRLFVCRLDHAVRGAEVLLRNFAERGVLAHVQQ